MAGTDRVAANSGMMQIELPLSNSHDGRRPAKLEPPARPTQSIRLSCPGFVRHPRARRYVIRLTDAGTVRVTIPRWGSKREAQAFAERERHWIEAQRLRWRERQQRQQAHQWQEDGKEGRARYARGRKPNCRCV